MARGLERQRIATLLFYAFVFVFAYLIYQLLRPFLVPLGWAAVLVTLFYPLHARLERRYGPPRAAALSTTAVTLVIVAPGLAITAAFLNESVQAIGVVQRAVGQGELAWIEGAWTSVTHRIPGERLADLETVVNDATRQIAAFLAARAGALLQNVAVFIFQLIVTLFTAFFLFRDAPSVMSRLRHALPLDPGLRERVIAQTRELVFISVASSMVVASIQGLLGGLAFAALGLAAPVFWGVVMAIFCLLPFGAWVVWLPAAVWLMASGDVARGLVLIAVGFGIVSGADNFLRPALLSGRARLNGLLVFIGLFGGATAFGALGLVLGPILLAIGSGLLDAYTGTQLVPAVTERESEPEPTVIIAE